MYKIADWLKVPSDLKYTTIWSSNEKIGAWFRLLFKANHDGYKAVFKGSLMDVQSGEIITSVRQLSKEWKWSNSKVCAFLKKLEDDNLISKVSDNKCTLIKICDYDIYKLTSEITQEENIGIVENYIKNTDVEEKIVEIVEITESKPKISTRNRRYYEDDELNQAFIDYVEMRKKIRKPMTERAVTLAKNKIAKYSEIPFSDEINKSLAIKILEQSVLNSWQGIFPLKDGKNNINNNSGWDDV